MLSTIITVGAFKSATALEHAYGFAVCLHSSLALVIVQFLTAVLKVATVMLVTTILLAVQMRYVKYWPVMAGVGFVAIFGFLDAIFWGAALKKIPHGAWVPVVIGTIL